MGRRLRGVLAGLGLLAGASGAMATQLVVVEARGGGVRPGSRIDSNTQIQLKDAEKVVLIAPDGRTITLRGTYQGPAMRSAGGGPRNSSAALAALISTRRDRASTVGAVRSGAGAAALPDPWLFDITRPGERCLREGDTPVWWRPTTAGGQPFTVYPLDRSWKADFIWERGADKMLAPELGKLESAMVLVVRMDEHEYSIRLNLIPRDLTDPVMVTSWMLHKACFQQADAYIRELELHGAEPAADERADDGGRAP